METKRLAARVVDGLRSITIDDAAGSPNTRDALAADAEPLTCERAMSDGDAPPEAWQARISTDRPVYGCPRCSEPAMQFYATHPLHPDRADFFQCHACGICWEM